MDVPRYSDLLGDLDDEDDTERGRALVTTDAGWRTEMAKWVGDQRVADNLLDSDLESDSDTPPVEPGRIPTARATKWVACTLRTLFNGVVIHRSRDTLETEFEVEAALMEALADQEEDEYPDDGAMEGSGDDYE